MSDTGDDPSTHFKFVESGAFYNIDSEILGILRAPGAGGPGGPYVVVSTTKASPAADTDKTWTISYNATTDTYRLQSQIQMIEVIGNLFRLLCQFHWRLRLDFKM